MTEGLLVTEQQQQLNDTINLGSCGNHDEQYGPEPFSSFQQRKGKQETIGHHDIELEGEDALLQDEKQEKEYLYLIGIILLG
jgi:hypothetical protein